MLTDRGGVRQHLCRSFFLTLNTGYGVMKLCLSVSILCYQRFEALNNPYNAHCPRLIIRL